MVELRMPHFFVQTARATRVTRRDKHGFTLVEILVCLAVLGIILSLAIPSLSGIVETSSSVKMKRQAQIVAQTYAAACAAGVIFKDASARTVLDALTQTGGVQGQGIFAGIIFSVTMNASDKAELVNSETLVTHTLADGSKQLAFRAASAR